MESELVKTLATGGPVAILAAIIFLMYVKDRYNSETCIRKDRVFMEDRLTKVIEADQATREAHTRVLTELTILLRTMNKS